MGEDAARAAALVLEPGDGLLTSIRGEPTNLLIPGEFTHAAIYSPDGAEPRPIVEAVSPQARETGLFDFFMTKDHVLIVRNRESNQYQRSCAAQLARRFIGLAYDYDFMVEDDEQLSGARQMYCAELLYTAHRRANPAMTFRARPVWGRMTITPDDFWKAKQWAVVWNSDSWAMVNGRSR